MTRCSDAWLACVGVMTLFAATAPVRGDEPAEGTVPVQETQTFLSSGSKSDDTDYTLAMALLDGREFDAARGLDLDLSPLLKLMASFLRDHGVAAVEHHHPKKKDAVAVSASFGVGARLPALRVQFGDRSPEPFGAFYSGNKGVRWALIWPMRRFTLRIEGGQDSEFGYFGIAGAQWVHPTRPMAFGFGIPMNLRNVRGDVGVIAQFRMKVF